MTLTALCSVVLCVVAYWRRGDGRSSSLTGNSPKSEARAAISYLTSYVYPISHDSPGGLKRALTEYATMSKSPHTHLDFNFQLFLLEVGKQWIDSQSANMDVRMVVFMCMHLHHHHHHYHNHHHHHHHVGLD